VVELPAVAKTTRIVITCDLHGDDTEASTSTVLTVGRSRYQLDLCRRHLDELVQASRRATGRGAGRGPARKRAQPTAKRPAARKAAKGRRSRGGHDPQVVRDWARAKGMTVSDRGRLSADLLAAYAAAKS
jgi:hypothetical protein